MQIYNEKAQAKEGKRQNVQIEEKRSTKKYIVESRNSNAQGDKKMQRKT